MSWHASPGTGVAVSTDSDLAALGIPDERSYIARYERRTGRAVQRHWNFYLAYNLFRLAAIVQGIAKRNEDGIASSPHALEMGRQAVPLAQLAWQFAQRSG